MNQQQIPNILVKRVSLTPDRIALTFQDTQFTFRDLYDLSYRVAGNLTAKNVSKGDYIAVLLKNHVDTAVILLGLQLIGAKAVILNNRLTVDELIWQIEDSGATVMITEPSFAHLKDEIGVRLKTAIAMKHELLEKPNAVPIIQEEIFLDDVCSIMYTSGTTGYPKGVLQTYGNHWWSAMGSALNLGLTEDDCWLCAVPLFHISGYSILMRSIIYGMKVVLHESFDEDRTIADIQNEKVTIMSVVSTMLTRLLGSLGDGSVPTHLRCMLLGGGPASLSMLEEAVSKNVPVYQSYGMTETSSQIVTLSPEYSIAKLGSAGKPLFPSQIKILDSDGKEVPANEAGEITVKGPNITVGYLNREQETKDKLKSGWLHTGDIGYLDEEGFLFVLDRRSDLIISGGENVYPAEIEGVLTSHPHVLDAGVIGRKDTDWGQVPVAFVSVRKNIDKEALFDYCLGKLARFKVPKEFYMVNEIPRNASKKILRRKLRELLEEGHL